MRRLVLLRHAKSSWDDERLPDHERPLSKRGERDAPRMGERLHARGASPSLIVTSPAKRAFETARIVARALSYPAERMRVEPRLYLAPPETILAIVAEQDDDHPEILAVGHNPGMTELVNRLLPSLALDNLPTAGVVAVDFGADRWSDVGAASGTRVYFDYPKNSAPL